MKNCFNEAIDIAKKLRKTIKELEAITIHDLSTSTIDLSQGGLCAANLWCSGTYTIPAHEYYFFTWDIQKLLGLIEEMNLESEKQAGIYVYAGVLRETLAKMVPSIKTWEDEHDEKMELLGQILSPFDIYSLINDSTKLCTSLLEGRDEK